MSSSSFNAPKMWTPDRIAHKLLTKDEARQISGQAYPYPSGYGYYVMAQFCPRLVAALAWQVAKPSSGPADRAKLFLGIDGGLMRRRNFLRLSAALRSLASRPQHPAMPVIGFLASASASGYSAGRTSHEPR